MNTIELLLIALGLSMDAFAVSITNGLCRKNLTLFWTLSIALTFGLFQGAMPVIGYILGQTFTTYIERYDHIVALVLLGIIGGKMVYESLSKDKSDCSTSKQLTISVLILQGIATSIDALAVGISFSALKVNIITPAVFIAVTTFILSFIGVIIGKKFGQIKSLDKKATLIGGLILIAIGIKIFIEHTFF